MDTEPIRIIEKFENTYDSILKEKDVLVDTEVTDDNAIDLFRKSRDLLQSIRKLPNYSTETLDLCYPNRGEQFFFPIKRFLKKTVDYIDFGLLGKDEVEDAVDIIIEKQLSPREGVFSGLYCKFGQDNFYHIRQLMANKPQSNVGEQIYKLVKQNNAYVASESKDLPIVSESLFAEMIEHEKKTFKIHLNLPVEKRKLFINRYLEEIGALRKQASAFRQQFELSGEKPTSEDYINQGFGLLKLVDMKFVGFNKNMPNHDLENNRKPDFVFHAPTDLDIELAKKIINDTLISIAKIIDEIGEDSTEDLARYSMSYTTKTGKTYRSISIVQGDSDFKNYLKRIGKLDQYFDVTKNHAVSL